MGPGLLTPGIQKDEDKTQRVTYLVYLENGLVGIKWKTEKQK